MSKLKYASFTLTLRQPYAAEIAALRWYRARLFELFLGILRGPGEGYGTFAKPRSHFTEGMFEKR